MSKCIVVYDDQDCLCLPMMADDGCDGAICSGTGPVVVFPDAKSARAAIKISKTYAELCKLQCKPYNDDFTINGGKNIRIRPVVEVEAVEQVAQ